MASTAPSPAPDREDGEPSDATSLTSYQRWLIGFLCVATFFEGYDLFALAQILPNLRADFGLEPAYAGFLISITSIGNVLAYLVVQRADRLGRRRALTLTIAGYTLFSFLTALARGVWSFAAFQLVARIFLLGEYAVAMVYAAEEVPADRRGMVIGVIQACASLGAIACAAVVPALLATPLGWRSVYLVGTGPLLAIAFARRRLRESARFERGAAEGRTAGVSFARIWRTGHRARVLQMGAIWTLTLFCTGNAVSFWKEFAMAERGLTDAQVGAALAFASAVSLPALFFVGRLLDAIGRRAGAAIAYVILSTGVFFGYTVDAPGVLTGCLVLGIFGTGAVLPVLNAYTAELFPTELRSEAFAWANNLIARTAYLGSPVVLGVAAERFGWGQAVGATAVFPLIALALILALLPETAGRELEDTAAL